MARRFEHCQYLDCPEPTRRRGLCNRHFKQAQEGLLGLDLLRSEWDGVSSPEDLPIQPKAAMTQLTVGNAGGTARDLWAVVMPYPSFDGTQKCVGYEDLFDEVDKPDREREPDSTRSTRTAEAATLCARCPFNQACYEWAMAHEDHGFWAGTTWALRRKIRTNRRQRLVTPGGSSPFLDRNWHHRLEQEAIGVYPHREEVADEWEAAAN